MLIYGHKVWKRKKSTGFKSCCHYPPSRRVTLKSSILIQLFIASTIMASSPDPSVNILNDRINVRASLMEIGDDGIGGEMPPKSIDEQIFLNENHPHSQQKVSIRGRIKSMTLATVSKPFLTVTELAVNGDKSKHAQTSNNLLSCVCTTEKYSCRRWCAVKQQQQNEQHSNIMMKIKRKKKKKKFIDRMRKQNDSENFQQKPEHVKSSTLIFGNTIIKDGARPNLIQPSETVMTPKFHRKPHNNRNQSQFQAYTIFNSENARGTNKHTHIQASINSHDIVYDPETNLPNFHHTPEIEVNFNGALLITDHDKSNKVKRRTLDSNGFSKYVKRNTRSIPQEIASNQHHVRGGTSEWHVPPKNTTNQIKTTSNEIIGFGYGVTNDAAFNTDNHNDYPDAERDEVTKFASNLMDSRQSLAIESSNDSIVTTTLLSINDQPNSSCSMCTTLDSQATAETFAPLINDTCIGDTEYCNLTEAEYLEMLHDYIFPTPGEWVLIGFHAAVFLVGLIGNILVCIAVYANATMRTVTNIFIVNLAIADLLVIILCLPPTVVWDVTETWFLGESMCKGILYLQTVSVTVSVLTLTFISIDRWYAICFPLQYVSTNGRAWCSIGLIWIGALLSDIPEFINTTTKKKDLRFGIDLFTQCVSTWDKDTEKNFYIIRLAVLYVLPLFLMSIAYFKIICVLWKSDTIPGHRESCNQTHTIHTRNTVGNSSTMSQLRARRKAAKMLVAVVVMFAICYLPVHCLNILRYTIDIAQNEVIAILSLISHWLCYANSAVNPLIYNFMSGKFRREFVSVLERCRCSNREIHRHHSCYFNNPGVRLNTISPNSRSLCHFVSNRDRNKSFREKHTIQTSFIENVCDIYPSPIENGQRFGINTNGLSMSRTVPNVDKQHSTMD